MTSFQVDLVEKVPQVLRILAKGKYIPCFVKFSYHDLEAELTAYYSLSKETPDANNCDDYREGRPLKFKIIEKNNPTRRKLFSKEYIYLTLVSQSGCEVSVSCSFNMVES